MYIAIIIAKLNLCAYNIGTPILRLDVCSESEISFTCIMNESTLHWAIDLLGSVDIDRVTYFAGDPTGFHQEASNMGTGVVYRFNLTSKSPLTSTMTTNTPTDLSGATVTCSDGAGYSADHMATNHGKRPYQLELYTVTVSSLQLF